MQRSQRAKFCVCILLTIVVKFALVMAIFFVAKIGMEIAEQAGSFAVMAVGIFGVLAVIADVAFNPEVKAGIWVYEWWIDN